MNVAPAASASPAWPLTGPTTPRPPTRSAPVPEPNPAALESASGSATARPPCPAPADFRAEVDAYDRQARVGRWDGPRYRMTYRVLGEGPPLLLIPGIA